MMKTTRAVALTRSQHAPTTRIPLILHALACKMAPSSCLDARRGLMSVRASTTLPRLFLAVFIILVAMGGCPQTCMNNAGQCEQMPALPGVNIPVNTPINTPVNIIVNIL